MQVKSVQQQQTRQVDNFVLPLELGRLNIGDNGSSQTGCYVAPPCLITDLERIQPWHGFNDWITSKLSLIDRKSWEQISVPNYQNSEYGYTVIVESKRDLNQVVQRYVFGLVAYILNSVDPQVFSKYNFIQDPHNSFDFVFKKKGDRNLIMIETECSKNWPQLGQEEESDNLENDDLTRRYFHRLYAYMLMNQVEYAMITTYRHTRFCYLDGQQLKVSDTYMFDEKDKHTVIGALVGMILHTTDYKMITPASSISERDLEFEVASHDYEYYPGKVVFQDAKFSHTSYLYSANGRYYRQGCKSFESPCLIKYQDVSKNQLDRLQWEAEVYKRLEQLQGFIIRECFNYGMVWDTYSMLVLQDVGRPLSAEDFLTIPNIEYKIMSAIKIMHRFDMIIGGSIKYSTFLVVNEDEIRVGDLSNAQYTGASHRKLDEIIQVRQLIRSAQYKKQQMPHAPHDMRQPRIPSPTLWRQNRMRKLEHGWRLRYGKSWCTINSGDFTTAVNIAR